MSVTDDLAQVATDLTTAQAVVSQAVTDLSTPAADSVGDQFLANAVTFLEGQGYTVTSPATQIPVTDGDSETPAEDSTDTPGEG